MVHQACGAGRENEAVTRKARLRSIALLLALGACAEEQGGLPHAPGAAGEEAHGIPGPAAPWALLGEIEGTATVGEITDFDVNDRGDVAFLDAMSHRITLVRATGEISSLGGRGQGPGELMLPRAMALMNDGSVAALDQGQGRITLWSPDGDLVGTTRVPFLRANTLSTDGIRLATTVDDGSGIPSPDSAGVPLQLLRFDGLSPLPPVHLDAGARPDGGHGGSSLSPFAMLDDERFILLRYRGGYNLTLGFLDGAAPKLISRDVALPQASPEAFRRVRTRQNDRYTSLFRSVGAPVDPRGLWSGNLPDSLPTMAPLAELGPFGADGWGRLWVARGMPGPEGSLLDVYDRGGHFLGEFPLSGPTLSGIRVRGSFAAGITYGPQDEPSLLLFRIPAGLPSG